jgi:hypothetical protein
MLIDELIEKAFSDGYEYALEEQREFAYLNGMVGSGISSRSAARAAKRSLAPSPKTADMWAKLRSKNPEGWSKTKESAFKSASQAKAKLDPMAAERAKVSSNSPKVSGRPNPMHEIGHRQAQRAAGNPLGRASQFLSGPGGMR